MGRLCVICDLGHASPRIPGLMTELAKLGWEVEIMTPKLTKKQRELFIDSQFEGFTLIENREYRCNYKIEYGQKSYLQFIYRGRRKAKKLFDLKLKRWDPQFKGIENNLNGIEDHVGWVRKAVKNFEKIHKANQYDMVLTTTSPFTAHIIGHQIARKFSIPWVADYRDLWTKNHAIKVEYENPTKLAFEKMILKPATKVITVSKFFSKQLSEIHERNVQVVYNGFYKILKDENRKLMSDDTFNIVYTGSIFSNNMDYTEWLDALIQFAKKNSKSIRFHYAGRGNQEIEAYLAFKKIMSRDVFVNQGFLSHEATLRLQSDADALLLFGWDDPEMGGSLQTKFYEYMAANKPIILFGGNRNDECYEILQNIGGFISLKTVNDAINFLENPISNLKNLGSFQEKRMQFSYTSQASKLDAQLRSANGNTECL